MGFCASLSLPVINPIVTQSAQNGKAKGEIYVELKGRKE